MKKRLVFCLLLLAISVVMTACRTTPRAPSPAADSPVRTRNEGYSLLHALLVKESRVDKALIMRKVSPTLEATIRAIAEASRAGAEQIAGFAAADGTIHLDTSGLPAVEVESRDAIESAETKYMLAHSFDNDAFLLRLALNQTRALKYGASLAYSLAKHEPDAERKAALEAIGKQYGALDDKVAGFLTLKPATPDS